MIHQLYASTSTIDAILRGKRIHHCPFEAVEKGHKIRLSDGQIYVYMLVCKAFSIGGKQTIEVSWFSAGPEEIRKQEDAPEALAVDGAESSQLWVGEVA
ncbi:TPA: hypothetical protein RQL23_003229 [Vibrio vulnificus]|uniref:hypothetical protein n=1 Tax=Vibrio vulnificus TaxID=672 RepID=UPI001A2D8FD0|nr:hypothetical protein [Vibrio vulnificus]HAS6157184.1 hypothetical protein [Vibrio vulnificus]HDY8121637.1 hypothetical protein [Vibrio vulnificus]HDY8144746.1 hypothetical protein [Vibrio vulnificus]HDY8181879.1 hypothetical protein [Vibrio vulnificus]